MTKSNTAAKMYTGFENKKFYFKMKSLLQPK